MGEPGRHAGRDVVEGGLGKDLLADFKSGTGATELQATITDLEGWARSLGETLREAAGVLPGSPAASDDDADDADHP